MKRSDHTMKRSIQSTVLCLSFSSTLLGTLLFPMTCRAVDDTVESSPIRDKWALVVGISKFQNTKIPALKFAGKDARDFRDYLVNDAKFQPDHVRLLLDDKATQRRVLSELGNKFLARVAKPDDLVVIYFSTHGSPKQADIRGENYVVAYDSDPEDLFTSGIEMDKILESVNARVLSKRVLLVLDACHSGVVSPGAKGLIRNTNFDAEQLAQGSGQLVITSSAPDQISWESKRYQNGIFTHKLLEGLRKNGVKTKLADAFAYTQNAVSSEAQEDYAIRQTPSLKSKWKGDELVLALPPAAPEAIPLSVIQILDPDSTVPGPKAKPAPRESSKYEKAVQLFNKGDFASSVELLKLSVKEKSSNTADAHYTLANGLVKLGKIPEALSHYRESFSLNPKGKKADYCLQMISLYSRATSLRQSNTGTGPGGSFATSPSPPSNGTSSSGAQKSTAGQSSSSGSTSPAVSQALHEQASQIRNSLPKIVTAKRVTPSLSEVLSWSLQDRANYLNEAAARAERAQQQVQDGDTLVKRVQSLSYSLIANGRQFGETEEAFQARRAQGEDLSHELELPYKSEVENRNKILGDETAILQACETALREIQQSSIFYSPYKKGTTNNSNCK